MEKHKIVLMGGNAVSTNVVFNHLKDYFEIEGVILEEKESMVVFLKRRIKRLGIFAVLSQTIFQICVVKPLTYLSKNRLGEIFKSNHLNATEIPKEIVHQVSSVNAEETIKYLKEVKPSLVVVNGTRIISSKVLKSCSARFINTHVGITPKYRGVHGGYWALVNKDPENCGVTVHFVDKGIDTGGVIYQNKIEPTKQDNFTTYPYLQLAEGVQLLKKAIDKFLADELTCREVNVSESNLWYHPTIWQYLYNLVTVGVK